MFRKVGIILVGFFCTGIFLAQAQQTPTQQGASWFTNATQQTAAQAIGAQPQPNINEDSFNFVIANPNTTDPKRFIFELKPGQGAQDYVLLKNASDVPLKFSLYGADETRTAQGSFALKTKGQTAVGLGKWISFDDPEIILQPGETRKERFTVSIPDGTSEGTYSGGVAAEKTKPDARNANVNIAVRIALRVDVKVTSNPQPVQKQYSDFGSNPFFQLYFWASLALFLFFGSILGWSYLRDNMKKPAPKQKKHSKKRPSRRGHSQK